MLVDQVTDVTPTLSLAVPLNAIVADDVEMVVAPGDAIVNVGGVVSAPVPPPLVGGVAGGGVCLVTVTTWETWLDPAVAVTVIVLTPIASVIFEIIQAPALPVALPDIATDDDAVDQVTEIVPVPDAAPDRLTVEAVVVAAVALTLSVKGEAVGETGVGEGVGVGAGVGAGGTEPVCAAYNVWTAAMSSAVSPVTTL
jgi:hypothetical protein